MSLRGLVGLVAADPAVATALAQVRDGGNQSLDLTAPEALRPFLVAGIADAPRAERSAPAGDRDTLAGRTVLAVTATGREAENLADGLRCLLPADRIAHYPAWETLPHERLSPRSDTVGRRLAVLRRLVHPSPDDPAAGPIQVVVAPVRAVLQPQVKGLADLVPVVVRAGDEPGLESLVEGLAAAAYHRVDLVQRRGEFAVRGGIVDVFPATEEHPLRVEFFGDEVEEVRYFSVADQRSLQLSPRGLWAAPCRELLLTDDVRSRARRLGQQHPALRELFDKLAEGHAVEGMESLAPVLTDEMELLVDLLPADAVVFVCDPERVRARAHDLVATSEEFLAASWAAAAGGGQAPIDLGAASYHSLGDVRSHVLEGGRAWWSTSPFGLDAETAPAPTAAGDGSVIADLAGVRTQTIAARAADAYRGDTERAVADIRGWLHSGWRVVLVSEGAGPAQRLVEVLAEHDVAAVFDEDIAETPSPSTVHAGIGELEHGFVLPDQQLAVLTRADIARQGPERTRQERMPSRRRRQIDPLELAPGDHVVHEQHGVGRYVEMTQRTVQGATREYLVIEFAASKRNQPADRLFVPTDQLDQVTRYVGGDAPSLDRLGGADWTKRKNRARKAVKQIAAELIKLYAARQATQGHAFSADTPWQRELEDAFGFVETPDQLAAVDEVKNDMERPVPMDRLICGDVGYGKTEIAVRAAFKAVQDGKQVVVLVPTTLLVQQHMATFGERFAAFPVNLRGLSRFTSEKESKDTLEGLASGKVDVVIGTHRLLSPDMSFGDLGLVIVDEEQRFGVEHKERLKHLRAAVDVLSMSATPIPRTLEMAITGIREMSTIATPPEERHPVLTFVGGYAEKQITAAIRRELLREGQVFYIHNRVQSIDKAAERLSKLVPEARIAVAHGQMPEHRLEEVMVDFWEKRFDVLVCTTIVEAGLDVSNANTLIIERSDQLGLSQLHQLRGRVGRGRERAYSYFLYPPDKPLTETAHKRLSTLAQNTELGAGMSVAMKDLEIRGAGNLIGGEQSGHIADVGFDLYVRLVGEAVADFRGDATVHETDVRIELPVDAHLPHDYVPSERLRLEMYKRLAEVRNDDEVAEVRAEIIDRYGEPPEPVVTLLDVARLRARLRDAGVAEISVSGRHMRLSPVDLPDSGQVRLNRLYPGSIVKTPTRTILVPRPSDARVGGTQLRDVELLDWTHELIGSVLETSPRLAAS